MPADTPRSFQEIILRLQAYWAAQGCAILQPYDMEVGAGTFHPATTLRSLGPKPWSAAYVQPSRRPTDGRYGDSPNRWQHYYQYQVIIKPSPPDFQDIYLGSPRRHRHRHGPPRHPLRRGRLGEPDARRLGPRLGGLVRRHGGLAVHLLPAGRRPRLPPGLGRAHLRPRAARHVRPRLRRRQPGHAVQRPRRADPAHLRRRLPRGRGRVRPLELRRRRHRDAAPPLRGRRGRMRPHPRRARHRPARPAAASSWRCRPTTSASRPSTSSTCSTPAG